MAESPPLKRPRFFDGQLLTAEALTLEQQYVREKLKRHNRTLHGFGIVSGLKVTVNSGQNRGPRADSPRGVVVIVEPGLALDCEGNEVVIESAQVVVPPPVPPSSVDWHTAYLTVRFVEVCADSVPRAVAEAVNRKIYLTESFELAVTQENSNRGHRHLRARWLACGKPHALSIAKLRRSQQGWRVDRGYRPPAVK